MRSTHCMTLVIILFLLASALAKADENAKNEWISLFDGRTLHGWKANINPESFSVVDGAIRVHTTGPTSSHLFYVGERSAGFEIFKNFELEATVRSEPNSNSGIFFHTDYALQTRAKHLASGYEVQLNSTLKEKRKTGSLYAVVDLDKSPVDESQWFKVNITVQGSRIVVRLNDKIVVDYTEPANVVRPKDRAGRKLRPQGGAIALQGHDPGSTFYFKDIRIRRLP